MIDYEIKIEYNPNASLTFGLAEETFSNLERKSLRFEKKENSETHPYKSLIVKVSRKDLKKEFRPYITHQKADLEKTINSIVNGSQLRLPLGKVQREFSFL